MSPLQVEETVHKSKKKKDKKKAKNAAKTAMGAVQTGECVPLGLSLDTLQQFSKLALAVPVNTDDVDASLVQLAEKKAYYEEKGKTGITLKELLKQQNRVTLL